MKMKLTVSLIVVAFSVLLCQPAFAYDGGQALSAEQAGSSGALVSAQSVVDAQASQKWKTIKTPEQLRRLHFKSEGFGPGYYKIGANFTLGEDCDTEEKIATCALLKGSYVIDFNGHTVQSAGETLATFTIQGANVTFLDSKASSSKVSVNALGLGCIEVRSGSATILNGNYACKKFDDAGGSAAYVGGGTLTINGGAFSGTYCAAFNAGGKLAINGGKFYGGYPYALLHGAGTTKLKRGTFTGAKTVQGYSPALGAFSLGEVVDFTDFLAKGSNFSSSFKTFYYNGQSSASYTPNKLLLPYAASDATTVTVKGKVGTMKSKAVVAPTLKTVKAGKKKLTATWGKVSGATKYQLRYSAKKNMKGAKILNVSKKSAKKAVGKLKSAKRYYVQLRTFKKIGGLTYYSAWSNKKGVKVK